MTEACYVVNIVLKYFNYANDLSPFWAASVIISSFKMLLKFAMKINKQCFSQVTLIKICTVLFISKYIAKKCQKILTIKIN